MNSTVVMLGAGGHAGVLREILLEQGIELAGYIAPTAGSSSLGDVPWLGADDVLDGLDAASITLVNGLGLAKAGPARGAVFENAHALGFAFLTVVDATAIVKASATLGEGVQVLAGAIVGTNSRIGANTIINSGAIVDHDCSIGAHSHLATGAALAGAVTVGDGSHVGLGARVIQGLTVGSGSTVGAGAVVLTGVADRTTVVGVPASSRP